MHIKICNQIDKSTTCTYYGKFTERPSVEFPVENCKLNPSSCASLIDHKSPTQWKRAYLAESRLPGYIDANSPANTIHISCTRDCSSRLKASRIWWWGCPTPVCVFDNTLQPSNGIYTRAFTFTSHLSPQPGLHFLHHKLQYILGPTLVQKWLNSRVTKHAIVQQIRHCKHNSSIHKHSGQICKLLGAVFGRSG